MATLEERRQMALKKADEAYYDIKSPHYKDNERFSWAVNTINKGFDEDIAEEKARGKDLIMADKNKPLEKNEPKALVIHDVGNSLPDKDYWKERCKLVEFIEEVSPCDPDINQEQIDAWNKYRTFLKEHGIRQ